LTEVAHQVVSRRVTGALAFDDRQLQQLARAAGVPQPLPRAWLLSGDHPATEVTQRLERWRRSWAKQGAPLRCGVARGADAQGVSVVAVVAVEALADLASMPRRVRGSQWLSLDATLQVPAEDAKVVLLGPSGRPRRVLTSLSDGHVRSRFSLDRPGRWLVQVLAMVEGGPEPLIEAEVFVDKEPPAKLDESKSDPRGETAGALLRLLNGARKSERVPRLRHDSTLDGLARAHAIAMVRAGKVAHDVGEGTPDERVEAAGIEAERIGENLARAPTVNRLHRALWDSPSHRDNMLDPEFQRVGIAIVADKSGRLWAVQLFAH
jgi:uncharacterized protein YkwD